MTTITFKGQAIHTIGELPTVGSPAPDFRLTKSDLTDIQRDDLKNKIVILSVFPSIDTDVCASSVRQFNERATGLQNVVVMGISADLPFAQKRFCGSAGIQNVIMTSVFRHPEFGTDYGLIIQDGPLKGLLSRAVIILDKDNKVIYSEQVPEITHEPDYVSALTALKNLS